MTLYQAYQLIELVPGVGRGVPRTQQCQWWHTAHEYDLSPQPEPMNTNVKVKKGRLLRVQYYAISIKYQSQSQSQYNLHGVR